MPLPPICWPSFCLNAEGTYLYRVLEAEPCVAKRCTLNALTTAWCRNLMACIPKNTHPETPPWLKNMPKTSQPHRHTQGSLRHRTHGYMWTDMQAPMSHGHSSPQELPTRYSAPTPRSPLGQENTKGGIWPGCHATPAMGPGTTPNPGTDLQSPFFPPPCPPLGASGDLSPWDRILYLYQSNLGEGIPPLCFHCNKLKVTWPWSVKMTGGGVMWGFEHLNPS